MIIDTHCHLYVEEFSTDYREMIERADAEGVKKFYLPAIDSESTSALLKLEEEYPGRCFAMMGLHPCSVKDNYQEELKLVKDWLGKRSFAAIGEIGLDFYWDRSHDAEQYDAFHQQVELARKYKLPIVIHSRDSTAECIDVIREHQDGRLRGIFHCFGADLASARSIIDLGFHLGIGGVLTFKNAGLAAVLKEISLDAMVLETDAPYLSPIPFRGKRNEPAYLKYIVAKLAIVKGVEEEEVVRITTANAEKIFGN